MSKGTFSDVAAHTLVVLIESALQRPCRGTFNEYHNICFHREILKLSILFIGKNATSLELCLIPLESCAL